MDHDFWLERWIEKNTPFDQERTNELLLKHFHYPIGKVFVPLCGKSIDMCWLVEQGHKVLAIELSALAIEAFVKVNGLVGHWEVTDGLKVFRNDQYELYVGDYFKLRKHHLEDVNYVYDRAAMIALPEAMRRDYVAHMHNILPAETEIFLCTLSYISEEIVGPPFSVDESEVKQSFVNKNINLIEANEIPAPGKLGEKAGIETVTNSCYKIQL